MAQDLFTTYTNRQTGKTTVMHGVKLCGYVEKCLDEDRAFHKRGFYYAVSVAKGGEIVPGYCAEDGLAANIAWVQQAWQEARA